MGFDSSHVRRTGQKTFALWLALALLVAALMALPASAAELRVTVPDGARMETVFDWSAQACEAWDVPDAPARAWKGADGQVRLLASHTNARLLAGPSLDTVRPNCRVVFQSGRRDDPGRYDDLGWLASPYTLDGTTVYALVHNEFHGHRRPALCPAGNYMKCWWNALTLTVSTDGGDHFATPARFVAGVPYRFRGDLGRRAGLFQPSNIIERQGWFYAMAFAEAIGEQKRGVCLMRTRDLADPTAWWAWDGRDFTVRFADPYTETVDPAAHVCAPLPTDRLPFTVTGLVRHASGQYVAVMAGSRPERQGGAPVAGIWASTSPDLLHWSPPRLVLAAALLTGPGCGGGESFYYPVILDPDARTRNFEDSDDTAYLYLTRFTLSRCKPTQHRDLVRVPIHIEVTNVTP
ncbi:MAG TPA: hypothetical protein VD978_19675 [Azospirillum sp.]|nr:hypothetical protein [Azospirillum sp.]